MAGTIIRSAEIPKGLKLVIKQCVKACKHEFQDMKFGKGRRAMNPAKDGGKTFQACRCTVCGEKQ